MKRNIVFFLVFCCALLCMAQMQTPVKFTVEQRKLSDNTLEVEFVGKVDAGWHVYGTDIADGGPTRAELTLEKTTGLKPDGKLRTTGPVHRAMDDMFGMEVSYMEGTAKFAQKFIITESEYEVAGYLTYGACNDRNCMPPSNVEFSFRGTGVSQAGKEAPAKDRQPETVAELADEASDTVASDTLAADTAVAPAVLSVDLWAPVSDELKALEEGADTKDNSLLGIFLLGMLGGLVALLTPCVWPIIPMTVSFFLKRSKDDKSKGIRDAVTYGISIIIIYLTLGLCVTAIFGSDTLNAMSTNAVFNILLFLLLVVFALSFFGWFEIKLPESWANSVDTKASATSGLISIFLMAFTLVLVSFSCTAPIIGLLLVETTTSGNWLAPALGMLGFAVALALPFTLFALFPSWLKSAPKSGGWMNILKVVLGFIELAFACKFFSVADLAYGWHLMDREVFLCLWIAIFGLLGLYLIGKLKFKSDVVEPGDETKPMPVVCIMGGLISIAFAIYMLPGLWGAPCKAVSAFAPPMNTQDFNLNTKEVRAAYTDYEQGMAAAAAAGKPVLLDFTGFGCVNCRKMEAAVWTDPTVADKLNKDYVLISLFVDDKRPLPEPIEVTEATGEKRTLRTIGDKWSYLQRYKFGSNTQPFYVCVDPQGNALSGSFSYKEDIPAFLDFLDGGLSKYRQ